MAERWRDLENRVLHLENIHLSDEEIQGIKKESELVLSIERKNNISSLGVTSYCRIVLKEKIDPLSEDTKTILQPFDKYGRISFQCHPAVLLGYTGDLSEFSFHPEKLLSKKEIEKIEKTPYVLYLYEKGEETGYYLLGLATTDSNTVDVTKAILQQTRPDIHLLKPNSAGYLISIPK